MPAARCGRRRRAGRGTRRNSGASYFVGHPFKGAFVPGEHTIVQCAPMRIFSQRSTLIPVLVAAALASSAGVARSQTARTVRFESATGQATVAVLLPADYDSTALRYPVLYLLHGGTQNHTAFPARSWFTRDASHRRMTVVMPHLPPFQSTARGAEPAH